MRVVVGVLSWILCASCTGAAYVDDAQVKQAVRDIAMLDRKPWSSIARIESLGDVALPYTQVFESTRPCGVRYQSNRDFLDESHFKIVLRYIDDAPDCANGRLESLSVVFDLPDEASAMRVVDQLLAAVPPVGTEPDLVEASSWVYTYSPSLGEVAQFEVWLEASKGTKIRLYVLLSHAIVGRAGKE